MAKPEKQLEKYREMLEFRQDGIYCRACNVRIAAWDNTWFYDIRPSNNCSHFVWLMFGNLAELEGRTRRWWSRTVLYTASGGSVWRLVPRDLIR